VCGGQEFIEIGGKKKHAISYLGDFLFSPERVRTPAKALSGGEQNRAILAKLFSKPANLLVLDEPTNDLDIETLELLEEILITFEGTVLLVSHDRDFMDKVITSLIVVEGDGVVTEHVGGYSDWETHGGRLLDIQDKSQAKAQAIASANNAKPAADSSNTRKLSYKEQQELKELPELIDSLEKRQLELEKTMAETGFYQREHAEVDAAVQEVAAVQGKLEAAIERWSELED
jgi:ATP-binding cassette subfamily F protein uup